MPSLMRFSMSNKLASTFFFGDLRLSFRRFLNIYTKLLPVGLSWCVGEKGWLTGCIRHSKLKFCKWTIGVSSCMLQVAWWCLSGCLLVLTLKWGRSEWLCLTPSSSSSIGKFFCMSIICSTRLMRLNGELAISFNLLLFYWELSFSQWCGLLRWTVA